MSKYVVRGGTPLCGSVKIHGAKNSALPILAATLLCRGKCVINNCPDISDVRTTLEILEHLGCKTEFKDGSVYVDSTDACRYEIPEHLMQKLRSSVVMLGSILACQGQARCSFPGGCAIGKRPIDIHLEAFEKMGAKTSCADGYIEVKSGEIKDSTVALRFPSVGATENVMLLASLRERKTVIVNAAREPEIEDLQNFLNKMGAEIKGAGTNIITVHGKKKLEGVTHSVIPDRIEMATYLAAAAVTGGEVTATDAGKEHIKSVTDILSYCGADIIAEKNCISIKCRKRLKAYPMICTKPYPGFPTDAQSVMMAVMSLSDGKCVMVENIFENRFNTAKQLAEMGADIKVRGKEAVVTGVKHLHPAKLCAPDLRGGAAIVIAALAADGESIIENTGFIDRGYENFETALENLGGYIKRI